MSTEAKTAGDPHVRAVQRELTIVSHSTIFYWWPVWAAAMLFGLISLFSGLRMAVVPAGTDVETHPIPGHDGNRIVLIFPKDADPKRFQDKDGNLIPPKLHISGSKNLGIWFCTLFILVITITSIPLRGLWSVIVIVVVVLMSIIFGLLEWWDVILTYLSFLDIRINQGGYFFIGGVLLGLWLVVTYLFDKQIYMVFTPGQLRVRLEIGEGETAYDTTGMTIQKQRSDLFRHWILGLGSGDLIVRTSGAQAHQFDCPNVLFLGRKVKEIEEMLRSRPVVAGQVVT